MKIRKNAKPFYIKYGGSICKMCGTNILEGDDVIEGGYCKECSQKKLKEFKLKGKSTPITHEFRSQCISCGKAFETGQELLFGIYCIKCGKKWVKERTLRQKNQLRSARGLAVPKKS